MKKKVLIFPCGSEIGLEIYRSLQFSIHFEVIGGSSVEDHGRFVYSQYVGGLPFVDDSSFLGKLNQVIDKHRIDFILPAHDSVVLRLAQAEAAGELHCEVVTAPLKTCEVARSKRKTYETLGEVVVTPKIYDDIDKLAESDFPVFLKPDVGQGSKGTQIAHNKDELRFYIQQNPSLLVMEYIPGKEFTIDCFTNKDGKLLFCEGRVRSRISGGISVNSSTVNDERFQEIAEKINKVLTFRGVWFFQLKENKDGQLVLMEIAPRVAGTMGLSRSRGANLALLSLFDRLGLEVDVFVNDAVQTIDRSLSNSYEHSLVYKHVYLDFDDLVIIDGKVNPAVMAFVYQCMNKGVQVHLLTKHKENLELSLKKYRLNDVFDEIIWIQDDSQKPSYIKHKDAILIDDSFAERKQVHEAYGIPVFDSHMIESLMEKF